VAALDHRLITGQGQYVDFSMAEALSASIPGAILDFQMNGQNRQPMGNRDERWAPHGVYHCEGTDRWVAIAVTNDTEWQALCHLIGRPDLAQEPDLSTADLRLTRQTELDAVITDWTLGLKDYEAMRLLQGVGVPAGPSLDIGRVFHEPQLRDVGYFTRLQTSDGEFRDLPGLPWTVEDGTRPNVTAAPVLAQSNDYVYHQVLGLSKRGLERLEEEQVIY
jgi:crotonobetainyl-CoA:carnitine CoA-transferase CaiB-like acyl-CoA transferase